jgi:hypothetical protein
VDQCIPTRNLIIGFRCSAGDACRAATLSLGEVRYACGAVLNGRDLGQRGWRPFEFDVAGLVRPGANELRVVVADTLANQYVAERGAADPAGYERVSLACEEESLSSGLFGPVRICAVPSVNSPVKFAATRKEKCPHA